MARERRDRWQQLQVHGKGLHGSRQLVWLVHDQTVTERSTVAGAGVGAAPEGLQSCHQLAWGGSWPGSTGGVAGLAPACTGAAYKLNRELGQLAGGSWCLGFTCMGTGGSAAVS